MKSTPGWENCVNVGGPQGKQRGKQRPRELDYQTGLKKVRDYLEEGFTKRDTYVHRTRRWLCARLRWAIGKAADQDLSDVATSTV